MSNTAHIAIDLGASGGRVGLGFLEQNKLEIEIVHRFWNGVSPLQAGLYWDVLGLWREILQGLKLASTRASELNLKISSVGVDSWAVDFALLDESGLMLDGVHGYRDARTDGVMEASFKTVSREALFEATGLQFLPFNTLYQLIALKRDAPKLLESAAHFLLVPDLLHFWLTGVKTCERTNASTTQFYNPQTGDWAFEVLEKFGIPSAILPKIIEAGSVIGTLLPEIMLETNLERVRVIAPGSHDTASAVVVVPMTEPNSAYISSGTWSLVGLETQKPVITSAALEANLTNEAGVNGTNRLLINVMGLWILQECRRTWGNSEWADLYLEAENSPAFQCLIDPDDARFLAPGEDMPTRVQTYCHETNQQIPESRAAIVRCVLESLALKYRTVLEKLEHVTKSRVPRIHVVGGGSQVVLLNQFTANATQLEVITGPVDATLTGNILVQAVGTGDLEWSDLRQVVRNSFELRTFKPSDASLWQVAYKQFWALLDYQKAN
jgi:rhamnulokinase